MIAKYKEHYYSYSANSGERTIVTENKEKAYPEFEYEEDDEVFYKDVSEEELSDIFDIRFFVEYDTQLPHTPLMWDLFPEDFSENGVYLVFAKGHLPNWEITDKYICRKLISYKEITKCEVVYEYKKKDGVQGDLKESKGPLSIDEMPRMDGTDMILDLVYQSMVMMGKSADTIYLMPGF